MSAGAVSGVVGIGASAGGIEAFRGFFEKMPADSGLAFVVLLHLPIDSKSMLAGLLAQWTKMRVVEASDWQVIERDCVYVPPPHAIVTLDGAGLRVAPPDVDAPREFRPIDSFFGSLAAVRGEQAIGIVLSGTGSDGALGLKAIKAQGGVTFAQGIDGTRPEHGDMPSGAIALGVVDLVVPVDAMPAALGRLLKGRIGERDLASHKLEVPDSERLVICGILRDELGHDFSQYKDKTFLRRVQRRMQVLNVVDIDAYIKRLREDRPEVIQLFRDLLIRVTSFFRDEGAFQALEQQVIPALFANKGADRSVRVWVPGCATGEEAYSLAILLREQMDRVVACPKVQIFATDIDEPAVVTARLGHYPAVLLDGLSVERRDRFFRRCATGYVVSKEIRDLCTFSPHSIVRDPAFSRMDLISCRNLLIYLDADLQASVIPAFHYSLVPRGFLLLGTSETPVRHEKLFEPFDKASRIFRKRDVEAALLPSAASGVEPQPLRRVGPRSVDPPATARAAPVAEARVDHHRAQLAPIAGLGGFIPSTRGLIGRVRRAFGQGWRSAGRRLLLADARSPSALGFQLREIAEQLRAVTEEHAIALEELRSANEELHSVNEEIQSTNEELETSKEEIQSFNEELHTVNTQLCEKVDELDRANNDLKNLFSSTRIATVFLGQDLIVRSFTPAVCSIYNLIPSDQGRPLSDITSQLKYDTLQEDVSSVATTQQALERRVTHRNEVTTFIMRILPYRAPDSSVAGTVVTFIDVTSIVQAEQHQRLLVDELNHRVKNMLTTVISLANQSLRRSESLAEFSSSFMGRVRALTASYSLLSKEHWLSVSLRDVLVEETRPYAMPGHENIRIDGPEVKLAPAGALALGMAIHELASNAMKFGALSVPQGMVEICWRIAEGADGAELVLEWIERNGPPVASPAEDGFGTTLIRRAFGHELKGCSRIAFQAEGVHATLQAPVERLVAGDSTIMFALDS